MNTHRCHAAGCEVTVPPRLFMCRKHWLMVPPRLKALVWWHYRPGQELTKDPSADYLEAARTAVAAVALLERNLMRNQP